MMRPFFILGTPRSRSAWLSEFLSTPDRPCVHEPSQRFRGKSDFEALLANPRAAAADACMMTFRWREIAASGARIVVVRRPLADVYESIDRAGLNTPKMWLALDRLGAEIQTLTRMASCMVVPFISMERKEVCEDIYAYCHGVPLPEGRWEAFKDRIILPDIDSIREVGSKHLQGSLEVFPEVLEFV